VNGEKPTAMVTINCDFFDKLINIKSSFLKDDPTRPVDLIDFDDYFTIIFAHKYNKNVVLDFFI
jgi:hypothetical protein